MDRETDGQTETNTETEADTETETVVETETERQTGTERDRDREGERAIDKQTDRQTETERERGERERGGGGERERERERECKCQCAKWARGQFGASRFTCSACECVVSGSLLGGGRLPSTLHLTPVIPLPASILAGGEDLHSLHWHGSLTTGGGGSL